MCAVGALPSTPECSVFTAIGSATEPGFVDGYGDQISAVRFSNNLGFLSFASTYTDKDIFSDSSLQPPPSTHVRIADTGNNRIREAAGLPSSAQYKAARSLGDSLPNLAVVDGTRINLDSQYWNVVVLTITLQSSPSCALRFVIEAWPFNIVTMLGQSGTCAYAEGISKTNVASTSRLVSPRSFCGPAASPRNICGSDALQIDGKKVASGCFYIVDGTMLRRVVGACKYQPPPPPIPSDSIRATIHRFLPPSVMSNYRNVSMQSTAGSITRCLNRHGGALSWRA